MSVIQSFGINTKLAIVTALGKESFGGIYPGRAERRDHHRHSAF